MSLPEPGPRILLFDLTRHIHLPGYLRFLVRFWVERDLAGELSLLVWHTFPGEHPDIAELAEMAPRRNVRFVALETAERKQKLRLELEPEKQAIEFTELLARGSAAQFGAVFDWELLARYARTTRADRLFVLYLDQYLPLLAAGLEPPAPIAGIHFASRFQYAEQRLDRGAPVNPARALRERFVLTRALRQSTLDTLFVLDPYAVAAIQRLPRGDKARFLPDPVELPIATSSQTAAMKQALGIEPGRRVLLLFGSLSERKGLAPLLEGLHRLDPTTAGQLCVVLAGVAHPSQREKLDASIAALTQVQPVQVVHRYGFVPEGDLPALFGVADVALTLYPNHAGSSGVLLLAAAAGKPVLGTEFGAIGGLIRDYELGITVRVGEPAAVRAALTRVAESDPAQLASRAGQRRLIVERRPERFAELIFESLGVNVRSAAASPR
jgi:glycosyltransferase involved in cell wall biosynthesis